jgi:hypothetical protein
MIHSCFCLILFSILFLSISESNGQVDSSKNSPKAIKSIKSQVYKVRKIRKSLKTDEIEYDYDNYQRDYFEDGRIKRELQYFVEDEEQEIEYIYDVKMYFLVTATAMDGFIACWDSKMHYDYARPYALIHKYYEGKTISGWKGEGKGWGELKGEDWRPYSPKYFLCPPFPSYVSGHSTISGGCGEILKLFKKSDVFGEEVRLVPGALTEPDNLSDTITLKFPTFTETAEMAGFSRVLGGYHIQEENIEGLILGRNVANYIYQKYLKLIGETE